jgi:hypothetical protein
MATVNLSSYTGTFHPFLNLGDAAYVNKWHEKNNTGEWFDASTDTRNWTLPSLASNATAATKSSAADGVGKPRYLYLSEIEHLFVDANKKTLNISDIAYMNDNVSLSDQATAVGSVALGKVKATTKLVVLEGTDTNPEGKKYRLLKHVNNLIKAQQNGDTTIDAYVVTLNDIAPKTLSASDWFIINGHFKLIANAIKPGMTVKGIVENSILKPQLEKFIMNKVIVDTPWNGPDKLMNSMRTFVTGNRGMLGTDAYVDNPAGHGKLFQ